MAKKKSEVEEEELEEEFDGIASVIKKYGDLIKPASQILQRDLQIFSTGSPNIDSALGGGIQEGCVVEIAGLAKAGKTFICMQTVVDYQNKNRNCYFFDMETRLDKKNLRIKGLDVEKLNLIQSKEKKILNANEVLAMIESIVKSDPGCLIILDSISSLISKERAAESADGQRRDTRPKLWSDFLCGISPYIHINRVTLILIRHMGMNQDVRGKKYIPDGGMKIDYYKDVSLHCTWSEKWINKDEKQIGKIAHFEINCSNNAGPVSNVETFLRFNHGVDAEKEILSQSIDFGLVEQKKSWIVLSFLDEPIKLQGEERVVTYLRENPEAYKVLQNKIKELLI
jgi:RecA/RadA recombinase